MTTEAGWAMPPRWPDEEERRSAIRRSVEAFRETWPAPRAALPADFSDRSTVDREIYGDRYAVAVDRLLMFILGATASGDADRLEEWLAETIADLEEWRRQHALATMAIDIGRKPTDDA